MNMIVIVTRKAIQYILDIVITLGAYILGEIITISNISLYPINYVWVSWRRGFIPRDNNITISNISLYPISLYPISLYPISTVYLITS